MILWPASCINMVKGLLGWGAGMYIRQKSQFQQRGASLLEAAILSFVICLGFLGLSSNFSKQLSVPLEEIQYAMVRGDADTEYASITTDGGGSSSTNPEIGSICSNPDTCHLAYPNYGAEIPTDSPSELPGSIPPYDPASNPGK